MIRYKSLKEYDPKMMRALYKGGKTKDYVSPLEMHDEYTKRTIEAMGAVVPRVNDKSMFSSDKFSRAILYNGKVYSVDANKGIHLNMISWLILNGGMRISSDDFQNWSVLDPSKVPFMGIHINGETNEIYFSESYVNRNANGLTRQLNSKFKKEKAFLEKNGGVFNNKFYKSR